MSAKVHTTNYQNTLITPADDSKAVSAVMPPLKEEKKTIANLQFEMIYNEPYKYTSDEVLFEIYRKRKGAEHDLVAEDRKAFFSKGQPCLRTSALAKQYGWGIHHDEEGRVALVAMESDDFTELMADPGVKKVKAMKTSR
ncbi:MAG: hypothetical protein JNM21_17690 [Taibaiella sp.]|nr:hypothetical protein [Taibaiella sp.]